MNLQLSLKRKWFEMTKKGIKTEDYRELTPYWCKRFLYRINGPVGGYMSAENEILKGGDGSGWNMNGIGPPIFKEFETNIMTLGYPKKGDKDRTLILEHKGIEIRTGNPEWGAEEGKLYFVIKHGKILQP
jgi:hypothetical protein